MYCAFFGLQEQPFNVTPDPRFLFLSQSHQEALGHLLYGIEERKGFISISGEVGTGKTLLCRALLNRLGPQVRTALIFNSFLSELELLRAINEDFGLSAEGTTRKALIDQLNDFLLQEFREERNAVLIIDEAQNLTTPVLEQIRMLSNLETERGKLLQIVLVGQPELRKQLARPDLRQLNQRIALRYDIRPFNKQETRDYISHRLLVAGAQGGVQFSRRALSSIYRYSQGIPRRINLLCDRALLGAYAQGSEVITHRIVRQASADLEGVEARRLSALGWGGPRQRFWMTQGVIVGMALLLGGGAWLSYHQPLSLQALLPLPGATPVATMKASADVQPTESPPAAVPRPAKSPEGPAATEQHLPADDASPLLKNGGPRSTSPEEPSQPLAQAPPEVSTPRQVGFEGEILLRALLWEYARLPQDNKLGNQVTLTNLAQSFGLEVVPTRTDLHRLKQFQVACLLETYSPATPGPTLLILRGSSPEGVELTGALGQIQRLTDAEFAKIWSGRTYLFHRSGSGLKSILSQGKQGSEVRILQQRLGKLGYLEGGSTGLFDGPTAEAVRRFQRDHNLQVDGVAGPATKMVLYHLVGRSLLEGGPQ